jgi:hypothetical protein
MAEFLIEFGTRLGMLAFDDSYYCTQLAQASAHLNELAHQNDLDQKLSSRYQNASQELDVVSANLSSN